MLQFIIQDINDEFVKKPGAKQGYNVLTVTYTYEGKNSSKKIMSFANPEVYKQVKQMSQGDVINVETTKNAAGYNEWAKVTKVEKSEEGAAATPKSGKVTGSNYETREERAQRQVLIVRQSALAQAVAFNAGHNASREDILNTAQVFVDWVFQVEEPKSFDDMVDDTP